MKVLSLLSLALVAPAVSFAPPAAKLQRGTASRNHVVSKVQMQKQQQPLDFDVDADQVTETFEAAQARRAGAALASLAPLFMFAESAAAKGGEFGIFEGRSASLLHPALMFTLFVLSGRAAGLGLRWRSLRTSGGTISELKEQLPTLSNGQKPAVPLADARKAIEKQIADLEEGAAEAAALKADLSKIAGARELGEEIDALSQKRKEMSKQNLRDRHHDLGSLILALGTFTAIEGPVNTYLRAGKLFPGPHLYAGAGIVVGWAFAASLVPAMQKGNEAARAAHIAINFGILGLFAWQINTGLGITQKVLEFTHWP